MSTTGDLARDDVLAQLAERIRPTVLAAERTLAVPAPLVPLFPTGGVVRGSTLAVEGPGATSVALALLAEATRSGSWAAVVGVEALGWAAAARAGVALGRVAAVAEPPTSRWAATVAALVEAVDVVVVDPRHPVSPADARRLAARCRERGSVLVRMAVPDGRPRSRWPSAADLALVCRGEWSGLAAGHGAVAGARVGIRPDGRRAGVASGEVVVALDASGRLVSVDAVAEPGDRPVRHLRRVV